MSNLVTYSRKGIIGIITVDNPPVNALGVGVRAGLVECMNQAEADVACQAVVLACAGRTFIAGADISEFGKPPQEPNLNVAIEGMENAIKPVVAAIHGTALGGGCEISMCCHYRVAVASAKLGQPEVNLGLIPGAGGTQRLPRLIGVEKALEMIVGGAPISAAEAKSLGLIDEVISGDLLEGAIAFAENLVKDKAPLRRARDLNDKTRGVDRGVFDKARAYWAKTKRGFEAPQRNIDAVENCTKLTFDDAIAKEREIFVNCVMSVQSAAQRHIFFAERTAAKVADIPKETPIKEIKKVGVLGAGTMGGGIAMNFVNAGYAVTIIDTTDEALARGLGIVRKNYERTASKGKITAADVEKRMGLITSTTDWSSLAEVDMVVEAVFEDMDIKKDVFKKLDGICRKDAILASNTSTLDVNEIASVTSRPEMVLGTHFFSPANVMKLVEVVRGAKTDKSVLATTMEVGKAIKKVPVVVGVCDGFVGNRMLYPYTSQAALLLEEGALPQQVDKAHYDWGLAMGPFAMGDLAGLDVGWRIRKGKSRPSGVRYSAQIADRLCEEGRYGQKTGAGWYKYSETDRTPQPDPHVEQIIAAHMKEIGAKPRAISDQDIIERCLYAMINEGAKILEEGIAQRASDIDVIYIYGYGFPVYRGGPMFYADTVGIGNVYKKICEFHDKYGKEWEPAPLLKKMADNGKTFSFG
ncbi:MAG: 3-hydroxyacyl-CoA dehydrogenase NAD-binding domain-containing protein [Candidatus Hydrogenedentota bacterium]